MTFRYKITYKNGNEIIVSANTMDELLNSIAKCISEDAYVKFTDVYTFFDGYTHKTIKQNKYMHVLPSFIALLKSEYTIKKIETIIEDVSLEQNPYTPVFVVETFDKLMGDKTKDDILDIVQSMIFADEGRIIEILKDGSEQSVNYFDFENIVKSNETSLSKDDDCNTYISITDSNEERIFYIQTPGFNYDNKTLYYSRVRKIMEFLVSENNTYIYNGIEFSLECDRDAKDKYRFRSIDKDRYMTIAFIEDTIDSLNYAGDIKLVGNMVFEKVVK